MDADIIGGFPCTEPNCKGCGKPLTVENAWMTDGCPCNHPLGINNQNETRWRLLMTLQQQQSHEAERLQKQCSAQQREIENLNDMADAVERLRDIGRVIGCDHVDGPEGRRQLVTCVDQEFERLASERDAGTAEAKRLQQANAELTAENERLKQDVQRQNRIASVERDAASVIDSERAIQARERQRLEVQNAELQRQVERLIGLTKLNVDEVLGAGWYVAVNGNYLTHDGDLSLTVTHGPYSRTFWPTRAAAAAARDKYIKGDAATNAAVAKAKEGKP